MTATDEISALYFAMRLIRHKVDITAVQPTQTNDSLSLESTSIELNYVSRLINEIQQLEKTSLQNLNEDRREFHLHSIAGSIERLVVSELAEEGYDDLEMGNRLLDNLRVSAINVIEQGQTLKAAETLQQGEIERKNLKDHQRERDESVSRRLPYHRTFRRRIEPSPFRFMFMLYLGLAVSLAYCLLGTTLLFFLSGKSEAIPFFVAYTTSFKTIFSLGLILGTALIAFRLQNVVPDTIEAAFTETQLSETNYFINKQKFYSLTRSISLSVEFILVGFVIFSYCQFPLSRPGDSLMLVAACTEYALGLYVIRKLIYTGMMLHSLLRVPVERNLFRKRELDPIVPYVLVVSTLTVIFVCVNVLGYYGGPFLYSSILGQSIKTFLLLPALIGVPLLLLLSFYPRVILRKVYDQSIVVEIRNLKKAMNNAPLSLYEKRSYLMEFDKMSRDELNASLKWLLLEALPTWITILITLLGPLLNR